MNTYKFTLIDVQYSITYGKYKNLESAIKSMILALKAPDCPIEADLTIFNCDGKEVKISQQMINAVTVS
jgi:hypothetical protein